MGVVPGTGLWKLELGGDSGCGLVDYNVALVYTAVIGRMRLESCWSKVIQKSWVRIPIDFMSFHDVLLKCMML